MTDKVITKRKPKVTRREDVDDNDELAQLRAKVAELEAAMGKAPRKKRGPFDDLADEAFRLPPHWDPRITKYYPAGSVDVRDMKRESSWTTVNDTTDYVVNGVHLRHVGAWEVITSHKKGAKEERTSYRVVEVQK